MKMAQQLNINGYQFWGYYTLAQEMQRLAGVYVIFDGQGDSFIDVGQTGDFSDRPRNHDRKPCWLENCKNGIYFAARAEPNANIRTQIEQTIRMNHPEMPCGEK